MTGLIGTAFSVLIRLELSAPGSQFLAGDHQLYNVIATSHGIIMIYFMVVPSMAGFGNYIAPVLVGAPDNNKANIIQHRELGPWLAGLYEGDGNIWIPSVTHAPSGKRYTPHLSITFSLTDLPLAQALRVHLGGYVRVLKGKNACRLTISSITGLTVIIGLIAPYLRTPKVHILNSLIHWMNANARTDFTYALLDTSFILGGLQDSLMLTAVFKL